jgi:hypothetical protein
MVISGKKITNYKKMIVIDLKRFIFRKSQNGENWGITIE